MTTTINANPGSVVNATMLDKRADGSSSLALQTNSVNAIVINSSQSVTMNSTGAMQLPNGSTTQRPSVPVNGMVRYNNTLNVLEAYKSGSWQTIT